MAAPSGGDKVVKAADLREMTRVKAIYTRDDEPTKRDARRTMTKPRQGALPLGRHATQAVAIAGLVAIATNTFSTPTTLTLAHAETRGHSVLWTIMDLGDITLDEFVDKHLALRDELALKAIDGGLSPIEAAQLGVLDSTLKRLLPQPEPLPREVVDAMTEVRRLLGA